MPQLTEKRTLMTPRLMRLVREARSVPSVLPRAKPVSLARAVGSYVPRLTRTAFEKHGFAAASLITDWERVVGAELAQFTSPERLRWTQGRNAEAQADPVSARPAATLVLRADPARALEAEYRARQIMERVNTYFGYRAVGSVKIVQAAPGQWISNRQQPQPPKQSPAPAETTVLPGIADAGLARALCRLKAGIAQRRA